MLKTIVFAILVSTQSFASQTDPAVDYGTGAIEGSAKADPAACASLEMQMQAVRLQMSAPGVALSKRYGQLNNRFLELLDTYNVLGCNRG